MVESDDDDFVAWVNARQGSLLRYAYLLTGEPHSAEDLVQTALAKAYLKWDSLEHAAARTSWVRRIITNEHTSSWRRPWRKHEVVNSPYLEFAGESLPDGLGDATTQRYDAELWAVVQALPNKQRAAVVLRYYEQLSEAETAQVLGCSVGTVKSQTHRALATLRARLEEVPA